MVENEEFRHIVRIASKDLNGNLPIYRALTKVKGIGIRMAKNVAIVFEKENGIKHDSKLGVLSEEQASAIVDITRKIFYPERNYRSIINGCVKNGVIEDSEKEKLYDFFKKHEVDVKRQDAVLVLGKIKELLN